jgi:sigma-B regulation protein RsbU (phosphoserine phosphatase)
MIEEIDYDEHVVRLAPGDRLYLYSDGVPEAMSTTLDQFTDGRMLAVLGENAPRPLEGSVDALFEAVRGWCVPNGPKDDVSILGCQIA